MVAAVRVVMRIAPNRSRNPMIEGLLAERTRLARAVRAERQAVRAIQRLLRVQQRQIEGLTAGNAAMSRDIEAMLFDLQFQRERRRARQQREEADRAIAALPTRRRPPRFRGTNASAQCAICISDFAPDEELVTLPCRHCFHAGCAAQWLRRSDACPLCRCSCTTPCRASEPRATVVTEVQVFPLLEEDEEPEDGEPLQRVEEAEVAEEAELGVDEETVVVMEPAEQTGSEAAAEVDDATSHESESTA